MAKTNQRGATLIEVMIAVFLFVIGMQGLLVVATQGMTMSKRVEYDYTAYNLAKNHIERLRLYSFAALANAADTGTLLNTSGDPDPAGPFTRTTTVVANYGGDTNLTQATVTVTYTLRGLQNSSQCQLSYVFFNNNGVVG